MFSTNLKQKIEKMVEQIKMQNIILNSKTYKFIKKIYENKYIFAKQIKLIVNSMRNTI